MSIYEELPEGAKPLGFDGGAESISVGNEAPSFDAKVIPNYRTREPLSLTIPGGRIVGMAQPEVPISQFLYEMNKDLVFADPISAQKDEMKATALLHITDIDGKPVRRPRSYPERMKLEQTLGYDGLELVILAYFQEFPPVNTSQLVIVKK